MARVLAAHKRVERLTQALDAARADFRVALRDARESGESVSELARRLGLSRARVQQLLADVPAEPAEEEP